MQDISPEIIQEALKGSMGAFEEIYKAYSGFVYSVTFRVTRNIEDAKEVTQDVFLKVHKNLKHFQFQSSLKTWVYRITVNTAINAYKRASKDTVKRVDYETALRFVQAPEKTDEMAEQKDNEAALATVLETLNPDQRACIILREIQGCNYKEMAKILKININTVRSRLKRAREALIACRPKGVLVHEL
ncbi:MAG: RNA polymerase sigma factor [Candidatus Omnitrophota bacterium]